MNTADIYGKATNLPKEEQEARKRQLETEQVLTTHQLQQVKEAWLNMNYTQSFLTCFSSRIQQLDNEIENHVLGYSDPSKDYILRQKAFERSLLSQYLEMATTGKHKHSVTTT